MTGLEEKHSVISKEDMQSAMDFVEDFSHELEKYPHRIARTKPLAQEQSAIACTTKRTQKLVSKHLPPRRFWAEGRFCLSAFGMRFAT